MRRRWTVILALVVAACGADEGGRTEAPPPVTDEAASDAGSDSGSAEAHPFTVGTPPEGHVTRAAGRGARRPGWGEDCCGTDEPYLVLSPDGTPDHPDVLVVALTGYQGYQGGLHQASAGSSDAVEDLEVDGEDALFTPAGWAEGGGGWADLVVAQGDADVAIRVTSPAAELDELAAVVPRVVVPDDHTEPPAVPEPPEGLKVVGAVGALAVIADWAYVSEHDQGGPAPETGYGVGWVRPEAGEAEAVVVATLPGRSADLDALAVGLRWQEERHAERADIGRDGDVVTFEQTPQWEEDVVERSVWAEGPDGDLVVAAAQGHDPPSLDALTALVRSVEPTDEATWDAFVADVEGGPGLHADPGRTELARGTAPDGRGWLLQDQPPGEGNMAESTGEAGWSVDPCLLVDDGTRSCPSSEGGSADTWVATGPGPGSDLPYTMVATRRPEAAFLRVTTDGVADQVPLVAVPGTDERTAVVVGEGYQADVCQEAPVTGPRTIQLVTEHGTPLPCPP